MFDMMFSPVIRFPDKMNRPVTSYHPAQGTDCITNKLQVWSMWAVGVPCCKYLDFPHFCSLCWPTAKTITNYIGCKQYLLDSNYQWIMIFWADIWYKYIGMYSKDSIIRLVLNKSVIHIGPESLIFGFIFRPNS